jgi:sarcosine oxidase subunit gamma
MAEPMRPPETPAAAARPVARSPLGRESAESWTVGSVRGPAGTFAEIREHPFVAQVDVRVRADEAAFGAIERAVGVRPTTTPNRSAGSESGARILWLGPDEWLVVDSAQAPASLESLLATAIASFGGTAVDVSAHRTIFELSGPAARDLLASACSIDLDPRVFGPGVCAQTMLARVDVVLDCLAPELIRVFVRASFATYLVAWLRDALVEIDADWAGSPEVAARP